MPPLDQFLAKQRMFRHLSQEQMAYHLNISQSTYCRWETGSRLPSVPETLRLAHFFSYDLSELCQIIADSSCQNKQKGHVFI